MFKSREPAPSPLILHSQLSRLTNPYRWKYFFGALLCAIIIWIEALQKKVAFSSWIWKHLYPCVCLLHKGGFTHECMEHHTVGLATWRGARHRHGTVSSSSRPLNQFPRCPGGARPCAFILKIAHSYFLSHPIFLRVSCRSRPLVLRGALSVLSRCSKQQTASGTEGGTHTLSHAQTHSRLGLCVGSSDRNFFSFIIISFKKNLVLWTERLKVCRSEAALHQTLRRLLAWMCLLTPATWTADSHTLPTQQVSPPTHVT